MPLVKSEYCRHRVRASQMSRHLRTCLVARRTKRRQSSNPVLKIERIEPIDTTGLEEVKIIVKGKKKRGRPKGKKNETNN